MHLRHLDRSLSIFFLQPQFNFYYQSTFFVVVVVKWATSTLAKHRGFICIYLEFWVPPSQDNGNNSIRFNGNWTGTLKNKLPYYYCWLHSCFHIDSSLGPCGQDLILEQWWSNLGAWWARWMAWCQIRPCPHALGLCPVCHQSHLS